MNKKKKKKAYIAVINFNNIGESLSIKRKRIEEALFNTSTLKKNKYLNINYIFLKELNFTIYYINPSLNDFNILNITNNKKVINLIIVDSSLKYNLIATNSTNLYSYIIINSNYSRYSFVDYSIFIIYKKIYSRFIRGIKNN